MAQLLHNELDDRKGQSVVMHLTDGDSTHPVIQVKTNREIRSLLACSSEHGPTEQ